MSVPACRWTSVHSPRSGNRTQSGTYRRDPMGQARSPDRQRMRSQDAAREACSPICAQSTSSSALFYIQAAYRPDFTHPDPREGMPVAEEKNASKSSDATSTSPPSRRALNADLLESCGCRISSDVDFMRRASDGDAAESTKIIRFLLRSKAGRRSRRGPTCFELCSSAGGIQVQIGRDMVGNPVGKVFGPFGLEHRNRNVSSDWKNDKLRNDIPNRSARTLQHPTKR